MIPMDQPAKDSRDVLADAFGRVVNYLRVSVTDRCNLRCVYCRPVKDFTALDHADMLSYEEYLRVIRLAAPLGLTKIRLTGGEPLARRGFERFLSEVMAAAPGMDVRLTTNGTLLAGRARSLASLGLAAVNISLDSLDPENFRRITGVDAFRLVRASIDECLEAGIRVKVNAVALKGVNDHELPAFLALASQYPLDVRFIEFMPIGGDTLWDSSRYWAASDVLEQARSLADIAPVLHGDEGRGPARMWTIQGGKGRLGVISGLSGHYCRSCNRLRLTCDGRLRPCLYSDKEYRLRPLLRCLKTSDERILDVLRRALARKPMGYKLLAERGPGGVCHKPMTAIGG
ncbi:GTP 3',8-cyclase [Fundidesulfovibrio magnetotacticus]|uniref:GTP 3',8-cyclase n=1 Tax=Fundidesulfovibrio magnetotacticus TaxID=2730080 RepID=A0A6V8LT00_9BACT|nr:GTP 3',8-cyclase MoaA [Fundidesulfovibrio magnetotacticus]GFK93711.1 GTP 3',8-cyclase [Fundidesulfovibrio magnetotacticus]